jgi:transposase
LRVLWRAVNGRSPSRAGAWITVRAVHRRHRGLPALRPCHRYGAVGLVAGRIVRADISEGAISNILARAREPLLEATATVEQVVLASPVVCSAETAVRVNGKTWWEWVFIGTLAVLHVIKPSRGKAVVGALFSEIRPEVWVSDMLASQQGHGVLWQVCLAPYQSPHLV